MVADPDLLLAILDSLPVLYADLFPDFFRKEVPAETKATCAWCAMCPSSASGAVESVDGVSRLFRPDTKCCTYYPKLPNYLVGAILLFGAVGYGVDHWLGSGPWAMLTGLVAGFLVGFANLVVSLRR